MTPLINKFRDAGGTNLVLIERGGSFGYNTLVVDFRSLSRARALGVPVIFDATHSCQSPGGLGGSSGGEGHLAPALLRAALAVGVEGIFAETHDKPTEAKSDGPNMIPLDHFPSVMDDIAKLHTVLGRPAPSVGWTAARIVNHAELPACYYGGIATYKSPQLCRDFGRAGYSVRCLLTDSAQKMVSTAALAAVHATTGATGHVGGRWCHAAH